MIFLDVKGYCHKCNHFEADVEKPVEVFTPVSSISHVSRKTYVGDTIVRCKHREICERMRIEFSHPDGEDLE